MGSYTMLFPLIFDDNWLISKRYVRPVRWRQGNLSILAVYIYIYIFSFYKNINIVTEFAIWLIENVIKPTTYQHEEKYLSTCFVAPETRQYAENCNVCTLNDDGFIYIVYSDICLFLIQRASKHYQPSNGDKMYFCGRALVTIKWNPFACWNLDYK